MEDPRDRESFALLLAGLAANFRTEVSEAQTLTMWLGLHDLSLPEMETATRRALLECTFFPNVSELRRLSHSKLRIVDGKPFVWHCESGWGRYWGSAADAARSVGEPEPLGAIMQRALPTPDRRLPRERDDG
jgi:hypothetical protein